MKDYNKFMKNEVHSNIAFRTEKAQNRNTIKVIHIESGQMYSVHPADQAIRPLRAWMKKFNN